MPEFDESKYPEIVKEVTEEIKSLGDNTKKVHEELRKDYEKLKEEMDKGSDDYVSKEKVDKFITDVSLKQDALDKKNQEQESKFNSRLDEFEVAMQRIGHSSDDYKKIEKEAKEFYKSVLSARSKDDKGATWDRFKNTDINIEAYKAYQNSLNEYLRIDEKLISPESYKALQVGIDPDGGFTVTPAMSARIIKRIFESDPIRELAGVESITTGALEWFVDWSEASSGWEEETVTGAETDTPTFAKKRIPVHIAYARPKVTQTLLDDSGINVEMWLADKVADKFLRTEAAAFVEGNGIGKPRGFLTYANGTSYGQIEQVASGNANALTPDGLIDLKYSFKEYYLNRGTFLMNRLTVAEIMKFKDGQGNYIWKPGITNDRESTLLGLPVRMSTTMPQVAAAALPIALADFKEAYMIVDRMGITVQRDPYTVKPFIEFYSRKRVGGDVVNYEAIKIQVVSA